MRFPWQIGLLGLLLGGGGFGFFFLSRTADYRELEERCGPELAWVKKEFGLTDADFERVRQLHQAYKPVCTKMCRRVVENDRELARLLANSKEVTPQIEQVLRQAAELRSTCQTEMLGHFYQVSRAMPTLQGERYLAWMQAHTLTSAHDSMVPKVRSKSGP